MNPSQVNDLIADEMGAVNHTILQRLASDVALVDQLGRYIVAGGGKRLRPQLVLLSARSCGYQGDDHVLLAAVVEFIHTATLLHDDVVDDSALRRGRDTANQLFGNEAAVLVGDFLYSRAFEMMVEPGNLDILKLLAQTTNKIAEGEVLQLMYVNDAQTSTERYFEVIRAKTAQLFAAAARIGGLIANQPAEVVEALGTYGMCLGTAFQLVDDVLDYSASAEEMGKNTGDDLAEGKPTLPLILTLEQADESLSALIVEAITEGNTPEHARIIRAVQESGALAQTAQAAHEQADAAVEALQILPDSDYKAALTTLARMAVERSA